MDAFGRGFRAFMSGDDRVFRVTRDDGYVEDMEVAPYITGLVGQYEKDALQEVRGRILDVGCGAGRVALWLQLRGFEVTGIDASPTAIEVCRERGLRKCLIMSVESLDFPQASFDTILMLGNNIGLAGTIPNTVTLFKKIHSVTTDEGRIIGTGRDPYKTDNPAHLAYQENNRKKRKPPGQVRMKIRFGEEETDWMNLLLLSVTELKEIAERTGWTVKKTFEGEHGNYAVVMEKATM